MSPAVAAYREMPAADRLEIRLPAVLKAHVQLAAERTGQTTSEYITAALAETVTRDLAEAAEWHLTVPEQVVLLKALSSAAQPTAAAKKAAKQARSMFGSARKSRKR